MSRNDRAALESDRRVLNPFLKHLARARLAVPGTTPPRSLLCAMLPQNAISSPSSNTGVTTAMSMAWATPA